MKPLRTLITLICLFVGMAMQAQVIVIEKTDNTTDEYKLSEVDSVAYVPAQKYYYYAGWECPTSASDLAEKVAAMDNVKSYGISRDTYVGFNKDNPFASMPNTLTDKQWVIEHEYQKRNEFVVVPTGMKIYDADDITVQSVMFDKYTEVTIVNHDIYISKNKVLASAKYAAY